MGDGNSRWVCMGEGWVERCMGVWGVRGLIRGGGGTEVDGGMWRRGQSGMGVGGGVLQGHHGSSD